MTNDELTTNETDETTKSGFLARNRIGAATLVVLVTVLTAATLTGCLCNPLAGHCS